MLKEYLLERKLRKEICDIGEMIYKRGFVSANDGNISAKICENEFLITPTNVSKGAMKPWMIVKTDADGNIIKGRSKISSEHKMHLRVYKENNKVNAVVHAHPQCATSFAIAGEKLDKALLTEAVVLIGIVPVADFAMPGTEEVPDSIAPFCKKYNAVMMKNHGVLTWGKDLKQAHFRMEAVENYAVITMHLKNYFANVGHMTNEQIEGLLDIRKSLGITTGGRPETEEK